MQELPLNHRFQKNLEHWICQQQQNSVVDFYSIILYVQSRETVNPNGGNSEAINNCFWQFQVFFYLFLVMKMIQAPWRALTSHSSAPHRILFKCMCDSNFHHENSPDKQSLLEKHLEVRPFLYEKLKIFSLLNYLWFFFNWLFFHEYFTMTLKEHFIYLKSTKCALNPACNY